MSRAKKSMLYITTFLPSFAIGMFLNHQLITNLPWPRPHLFFLTLGLFLTTFLGGFILEERFVWKGLLSESEGPWTSHKNIVLTTPISFGLAVGIFCSLKLA